MERISKALEKSHREMPQEMGAELSLGPTSMERISKALEKTQRADPTGAGFPDRPQIATPSGIKYPQTRSVPISRAFLGEQRVVAGCDPGPFVDAYKILRTKVLQRMREQGWNTLGITSPSPNAGKTLTAINLAISIALEVNQTVLLVDADLRHPSVHRFFGIEPTYGLSDYLLDNTPLQNILISPQDLDEGFVILPGKRPLPNPSEMISSPKMQELVEDLKTRYPSRIVVFDLPHLGTADTLAFAPYVDAMLLVIEEGRTTQEALQEAIEQLRSTELLGTVLNKAAISDSSEQ